MARLLSLRPAKGGKEFVGIKFSRNEIEFYYPESFRWENEAREFASVDELDENTCAGIRAIMASIDYAKTHSKEKTLQNDMSDKEEPFAMKSYLWMIRDYMKNGWYKSRETVFKTNQKAKINWKRTLSKLPMYSDGDFIYKDFVASVKNQAEDILVEIHKFCVRKSMFLIGWLYGIRATTMGVKRMSDVELSESQKKRYLYAIKYELDRTFDDEKRERLNHMRFVVKGLNKSKDGKLVYGVDSYDHVYECAVERVFGTEKDLKRYNPYSQWSNGKQDSYLYIDTLLKHNGTYLVVDSKCYRYAEEGYANGNCLGLPDTNSVQKQITYGDSVRKTLENRKEEAEIYNCFLLPYNKHKNYGSNFESNEFLKYSGIYATANWREGKYAYEKVYVAFVDMRDVIEKAQSYNHQIEQQQLVELIKGIA